MGYGKKFKYLLFLASLSFLLTVGQETFAWKIPTLYRASTQSDFLTWRFLSNTRVCSTTKESSGDSMAEGCNRSMIPEWHLEEGAVDHILGEKIKSMLD